MTPASATYDDQPTPQTADALSARAQAGAGLVPSPAGSASTSHKKRPSAIGLNGSVVGTEEITPTSAKKRGGKKPAKATAKGRKVS